MEVRVHLVYKDFVAGPYSTVFEDIGVENIKKKLVGSSVYYGCKRDDGKPPISTVKAYDVDDNGEIYCTFDIPDDTDFSKLVENGVDLKLGLCGLITKRKNWAILDFKIETLILYPNLERIHVG